MGNSRVRNERLSVSRDGALIRTSAQPVSPTSQERRSRQDECHPNNWRHIRRGVRPSGPTGPLPFAVDRRWNLYQLACGNPDHYGARHATPITSLGSPGPSGWSCHAQFCVTHGTVPTGSGTAPASGGCCCRRFTDQRVHLVAASTSSGSAHRARLPSSCNAQPNSGEQ